MLLGAPLDGVKNILTECAALLTKDLTNLRNASKECFVEIYKKDNRKRSLEDLASDYNKLTYAEVKEAAAPTLETFYKDYFLPKVPVKLKGLIGLENFIQLYYYTIHILYPNILFDYTY